MLLDTAYQVETPEGIDLHAQLAGPVPRALAYIIDLVLRVVVLSAVLLLLSFAGAAGFGVTLLIYFLLEWFYPVVFEVYRSGQTPGKKIMGLQAVNDDLTPVNWSTSTVRNLLRAVDFFPFAYFGGLTCMVLNANFQRMGDLAAGTLVIYRLPVPDALPLPNVQPKPPRFSLSVTDQIAVINFTQRHEQLTQSRQRELASILKDVLHCEENREVQTLQSIGRWLLGGRQ